MAGHLFDAFTISHSCSQTAMLWEGRAQAHSGCEHERLPARPGIVYTCTRGGINTHVSVKVGKSTGGQLIPTLMFQVVRR